MDFTPGQIAQMRDEESDFEAKKDAWIKDRASQLEADGLDPVKAQSTATSDFLGLAYLFGRSMALKSDPRGSGLTST
jgi:hypothetical protein